MLVIYFKLSLRSHKGNPACRKTLALQIIYSPQAGVQTSCPLTICHHLRWTELDCFDNHGEHYAGPLHWRHHAYCSWWPRGTRDASSSHMSGEGNGNPLWYFRLRNPMDGGGWWATVHGVAKSCTRLSDWTTISGFIIFVAQNIMGNY